MDHKSVLPRAPEESPDDADESPRAPQESPGGVDIGLAVRPAAASCISISISSLSFFLQGRRHLHDFKRSRFTLEEYETFTDCSCPSSDFHRGSLIAKLKNTLEIGEDFLSVVNNWFIIV